jgi:hypothetical protein
MPKRRHSRQTPVAALDLAVAIIPSQYRERPQNARPHYACGRPPVPRTLHRANPLQKSGDLEKPGISLIEPPEALVTGEKIESSTSEEDGVLERAERD